MLQVRGLSDISALGPAFRSTLTKDASLSAAIQRAVSAVHRKEGRLARDQCLDHLIDLLLAQHLCVKAVSRIRDPGSFEQRARDYLHDQMANNIGLDDLANHSGIDRFRLTRQFNKSFGLSPHAYLVRLRLRTARTLLAQGLEPAQVAIQVGFSDQSQDRKSTRLNTSH